MSHAAIDSLESALASLDTARAIFAREAEAGGYRDARVATLDDASAALVRMLRDDYLIRLERAGAEMEVSR